MSKTIDRDTHSVAAVLFAIGGGRFRIRLDDKRARPGQRSGKVLNDAGEVIGSASDYIYGGSGFAVHTRPFGGYVSADQIDFVS